ncbi:MAG TPA: DUF4404 family protein [Anaerolineales bacterium]|nr:DUF4404 family protein [Anaerolineales bacterium]
MANEELRRSLQQLHEEIENVHEIDDEGRALLQDLDGHIQQLLARPSVAAVQPKPGLNSGLEDAIRHFEVTHPALTEALSDLLTALSNAGI